MEQGAIPEADARLLTRAILGLYNSVFHWYRPRGDLALADVAASTSRAASRSPGCRGTARARPGAEEGVAAARGAKRGQTATGSR